MPDFNMRWVNRGTSAQDWNIQNLDQFTLQPNYVRAAQITLNANHVFNIAADSQSRFAGAVLTYTAGTGAWTLATQTPNEWQLAVAAPTITLRCLLSDAPAGDAGELAYSPSEPALDD